MISANGATTFGKKTELRPELTLRSQRDERSLRPSSRRGEDRDEADQEEGSTGTAIEATKAEPAAQTKQSEIPVTWRRTAEGAAQAAHDREREFDGERTSGRAVIVRRGDG
jgi:hypothetical protein